MPAAIYLSDGPVAKAIARAIPSFPFKGIENFYDIQGFLSEPELFQQIIDVLVDHYRPLKLTKVLGVDARGFILGPPLALALKIPFIMIRKAGKMPNTVTSKPYSTEYGFREGVCLQRGSVSQGDRVVIIDDLVATGGTLGSCVTVVQEMGATVVECGCVVELNFFKEQRSKLFQNLRISDVPIWAMLNESILTNKATLPQSYIDDGEEHGSADAAAVASDAPDTQFPLVLKPLPVRVIDEEKVSETVLHRNATPRNATQR